MEPRPDIPEADIVIMQETKIQRKDLRDDMVLVPGWDVYFSLPKHKKGYSGVAIYTRNSKCAPIRAEEGVTGILCPPNSTTKFRELPEDQQIGGYPHPGQLSSSIDEATLDSEGRCVILEFPAFVLFGVYSPATRDETRTEFRLGFIEALDARIRNLVAMGKQVILTGDLNIIRDQRDTAGLAEQLRKEGVTLDDFLSTPARRFFNHLVFGGKVMGERDEGREKPVMWDLCREFHPSREGMYTCWDTKKNCRPGNFGSRIDYVVCTDGIKDWFVDSNIQEGLLGSDHCPVYATLGDVVKHDGKDIHIEDLMNPAGMFENGQRLRDWTVKDLLPLSAKLIPEFDRRRSIKDMFFKKPSSSTNSSTAKAPTIKPVNNNGSSSTSSSKSQELPEDTVKTETPPPTPSLSQTSTQTSPQKRQLARSESASRPQKKSKAASGRETSNKTTPGPGQSSLTGFFKPKSSTVEASAASSNPGKNSPALALPSEATTVPPSLRSESLDPEQPPEIAQEESPLRTPASASADKEVFDPIQNKESWSRLLGKRVPPKCEHGEPCMSLVTKKPGVNCGRSFYICRRPLGPSGQKETGTQWRCGTFIWSSDWTGGQQ
ncbi:uncharacterized protein E0L32_004975 [Thyridium curvatum]|uniref:DNA-(apurinic or apyrimidinic site) endonuclease 2 n=1 Tax=Thyridium curvatum TaxID=1093900 RepID=A0A507B6W5_9PEZI|nr:uncharacterized protein E0L32_004975 [Thyridium curvatum]TPX14866.1 hypothetical protein E0L32_004975 [Thyridium curvatum]